MLVRGDGIVGALGRQLRRYLEGSRKDMRGGRDHYIVGQARNVANILDFEAATGNAAVEYLPSQPASEPYILSVVSLPSLHDRRHR
jgi:hypothetical protein